jgi:hypothetical protein
MSWIATFYSHSLVCSLATGQCKSDGKLEDTANTLQEESGKASEVKKCCKDYVAEDSAIV